MYLGLRVDFLRVELCWVADSVDDDVGVHVISSAHSLRVGGRRPTPATPVTLTSTDYFKESNTNITIP